MVIESEAPPDLRRDLRSVLADHIRHLEPQVRSAVLLAFLQVAPALLEPLSGAPSIATPREIDRAARSGKPSALRIAGRVIIFSVMLAGILATLTAIILTIRHVADRNEIIGNAAQESLLVGWIALTAAFPAAVLYSPSVGRPFRGINGLQRVFGPAIAAGIVSTGLAAIFIEGGDTLFLRHDMPIGDYLILFGAMAAVVALVITMIPVAISANSRAGSDIELRAVCSAAGPAVAVATIACAIALLFGFTALSQLWPLLAATAATCAVSLTNIDLAAGSAARVLFRARELLWARLAAFGSAMPLALALIGVMLTRFAGADPAEEAQRIDSQARDHWSQDFLVGRGHNVIFKFE